MSEAIELFIAARTEVGKIRGHNEDDFLVCRNIDANEWFFESKPIILGGKGAVVAIADGMGGENAGEIASRISMETVKQRFSNLPQNPYSDREACDLLEDIILNAHKDIVNDAAINPTHARMGTTIILAWFVKQSVHIAWVGDSRCYLLRKGRLSLLTDDHAPVWDMVRKGKISAEEARAHPDSNFISQHLGQKRDALKPDTKTLMLQRNDTLLLCSDGLNSMISDTQIEAVLNESTSLQNSASNLVEAANQAGGHDNTTVLLVKLNGEQELDTLLGNNQTQKTVNHDLESIPEMPPLPKKSKRINILGWLILIAVIVLAAWLANNFYRSSFFNSDKQYDNTTLTITEQPPPPSDTINNQVIRQPKTVTNNLENDGINPNITPNVSASESNLTEEDAKIKELNSLLRRKEKLKNTDVSKCRFSSELKASQDKVKILWLRFDELVEFADNAKSKIKSVKKSTTDKNISELMLDITNIERVYNEQCSAGTFNQPRLIDKQDNKQVKNQLVTPLPSIVTPVDNEPKPLPLNKEEDKDTEDK